MLHSLRCRRPDHVDEISDTQAGLISYAGSAHGLHGWALAKIDCTKEEQQAQLAGKAIASLRGGVMLVAGEIGRGGLLSAHRVQLLVDAICDRILPAKQAETRELFRQCQRPNGPLVSVTVESTTQYISRRRRWWRMLIAVDNCIAKSPSLLGGLLLDLAGVLPHPDELRQRHRLRSDCPGFVRSVVRCAQSSEVRAKQTGQQVGPSAPTAPGLLRRGNDGRLPLRCHDYESESAAIADETIGEAEATRLDVAEAMEEEWAEGEHDEELAEAIRADVVACFAWDRLTSWGVAPDCFGALITAGYVVLGSFDESSQKGTPLLWWSKVTFLI